MLHPTLLYPALACALAVVVTTTTASANCARPTDYEATVQGNTVTICPSSFDGRRCPDPGLLRVGAAGSVVIGTCGAAGATNPFYGDADAGASPCYVDECVPPGDYQYGYATPFPCCPACCGTAYYAEVKVKTDLPRSCVTSATPYNGSIPWTGLGRYVCSYQSGPEEPGIRDSPSGGKDTDSGGCTVRLPGGASGAVLGFNILVALLGVVLMVRRRPSHAREPR